MNAIAPDVAVTGNHDFDFGYPHLTELIKDTNFPWLLSNIVDNKTSRIPEHVHEFHVLERAGIRIGVIGLVEKEWISTVSSWPENFEYRDMAETAKELSLRLRDPEGKHKCDIVIALTHARVPNDIALAKAIGALSPTGQTDSPGWHMTHGVDLILGGHDHLYYVSHGVTSWEGYDTTHPVLGAEADRGDVLVIKSGTDFRDLSEFALELVDAPPGGVRRKAIAAIRGKRHSTQPGSKKNAHIAKILESVLSSVSDALKAPVCKTAVELDLRSELIRTQETASANWFADVLRHCYDDAPTMGSGSDGVFICAGTLRGDSTYGPGNITLGDIMEILPFEDPIVALEIDGASLWDAFEQSLSTWPAQEGRFPVISGFRVSWDSRRAPGQRVLGVWLVQEPASATNTSASPTPLSSATASKTSLQSTQSTNSGASTPVILVDGESVPRSREGRKYRIITREYMAQGHDGFLALKDQKYLVDDESGQMMSQIVRKYLLGRRYVNRMSRFEDHTQVETLHPDTPHLISREKARQRHYERRSTSKTRPEPHHQHSGGMVNKLRSVAKGALRWSRGHYRDHIDIAQREHMSEVDHFDGKAVRRGRPDDKEGKKGDDGSDEQDLAEIHPVLDGRLRDEGRS